MGIFARLQQLRQFEKRHLSFLHTFEDFDLLVLIGLHQGQGHPITMKRITAFDIGSVATLQRRLARLKRLGVIIPKPLEADKRNVTLELNPRVTRIFQRYEKLLESGEQLLITEFETPTA
jgi:DNA-binding MarR family transcriptional regulator